MNIDLHRRRSWRTLHTRAPLSFFVIATVVALLLLALEAASAADAFVQPKPMGFGCPNEGTVRALILATHTDADRDGTFGREALSHWMEQFKIGECVLFTEKTGGPWKVDMSTVRDYDGDGVELVLITYAGRDANPNKPLYLWIRPDVLQALK
jgi:hypothetical protein